MFGVGDVSAIFDQMKKSNEMTSSSKMNGTNWVNWCFTGGDSTTPPALQPKQPDSLILMVALHPGISSHYCSAEPPDIYYDKFL